MKEPFTKFHDLQVGNTQVETFVVRTPSVAAAENREPLENITEI